MTPWLAVVLVGLGSLAFRVGPLLAARSWRPGPGAQRVLGHVQPAVLSALAVTALLRHEAAGRAGDPVGVVAGLAVASVVSARRGPMIVAVVGGLGAYWGVVGAAGALIAAG